MIGGALATAVLASAFPAQAAGGRAAAAGLAVALPDGTEGLALLDWDGDGRLELLIAAGDGLRVAALARDGGLAPLHVIERGDARTLAWCVDESSRPASVLTLADDGALLRHRAGAEPQVAARVEGLSLPGGVFGFPFARDLDGDGDADFALPAARGLALWFVGEDGAARRGPVVRHRVERSVELPALDAATPRVETSIRIPDFTVADQNGDGRADLAFESEERLEFFWSRPDGALPETPTFDLDLEELRRKLDAGSRGILDPANLLRALAGTVSAEVRDLDGDGHADLLLRQGSKVSLHAGSAAGIDRSKASQVLKVSGNLLLAFAQDDGGDGREDLCLLQAQDVSIGQVLLWVIAGGSLEFDLYTYFQEAPLRFSRSPSRRRRLVVDLPALLGVQDEVEDSPVVRRLVGEFLRVPVGLDLDGDGARGDVAELRRDGTVAIHRGRAALAAAGETSVAGLRRDLIERFDRAAAGKERVEVGLFDLVDWVPTPGSSLRAAIAGREPARVVGQADPSAAGPRLPQSDRLLIAADLDGDRRDDLLLLDFEPLELRVFFAGDLAD